jgi:hypothetical protein
MHKTVTLKLNREIPYRPQSPAQLMAQEPVRCTLRLSLISLRDQKGIRRDAGVTGDNRVGRRTDAIAGIHQANSRNGFAAKRCRCRTCRGKPEVRIEYFSFNTCGIATRDRIHNP